MGGLCNSSTHAKGLSEEDMALLRHNLTNYKTKAQEYESQIIVIQEQIRARTAVPPGSEKHSIRFLISRELEDLRMLLLALVPDGELPNLGPDEQDFTRFKLNVERWQDLAKTSLQRLFQMKLRLQQSLAKNVKELQATQRRLGKEELVPGQDLLQQLLSEYTALLEETHALASSETPGNSSLAERIAREEAVAESLTLQCTDMNSTVERLRSELARKHQQFDASKDWEEETADSIEASEAELGRLKNELVQCKEKIRDLGFENDKLEKALAGAADPLSEEELLVRTQELRASVEALEERRMELQVRVFALRGAVQEDEEKIADYEQQLLRRESIEDVGEKLTSVQEKLRDLMVSLESVSSEDDYSPRGHNFD